MYCVMCSVVLAIISVVDFVSVVTATVVTDCLFRVTRYIMSDIKFYFSVLIKFIWYLIGCMVCKKMQAVFKALCTAKRNSTELAA